MKQKKEDLLNKYYSKIESIPIKYLALSIFLFVFIVYARTIDFDYVYCDDNLFCLTYEKQNEDISNIYKAFTETLAYGSIYYRPILRITFIIENQIAGTEPFIYHLSNVLFHAVGSMLVFLLLIRLGYSKIPSLFFGVLFAVHPVLTPAATWISGRNDSLITIFLILSFIYLIKYKEEAEAKKIWNLSIHFILFAISLLTKETAVLFPIVSVGYIYLFRKEKIFEKSNYPLYLGWALLIVLWYVMREISIGGFDSPDEVGFSPLLHKFPVIFTILSKAVFPYNLAPLSDINALTVIIGSLVVVAITYISITSKNLNKSKVIFGVIWYIMYLFPSLAVRLYDDFFDYAEHRAYMLLIGVFIIAMEIFKAYKVDFKKRTTLIIISFVLIVFTALSFVYQGRMEDKFSFWLNIRKNFPEQQKAYIMLGEYYQQKDSLKPALLYFNRAFKLGEPTYNLHVNTSAIHLKMSNFIEAERHARLAIQKDSISATALYNLAKALTGQNRHREATQYFEKAIERTNNIDWLIDLGNNYFYLEQYHKAIEVFEKAMQKITKRESLGAIYSNLGSSYANINENDKAEELFLKALELSHDKQTALINLVLFYSLNKPDPDRAMGYANQMKQLGFSVPPHIVRLIDKVRKNISSKN
jgi:tetratricopeptide (TPR) repeat protein